MKKFVYETILSEIDQHGVRTITLNRPAVLNAMNRSLIKDLGVALDDANADEATRVIILTGAGRAFCAGDDRKEHCHPAGEQEARDLVESIQRTSRSIIFGRKPVVGAINGWAVGGGFEWAINCDFPIWADSAKAFFPEVSLGVFVTGGVTALLPALVGLNRAREMLFLGKQYNARELFESGVAWRVVHDDLLIKEAVAVARQLSKLPAGSTEAMKRVLGLCATSQLERALSLETDATVERFLDPETTRRMTDF